MAAGGSMYVCGEQHKELSMRIVPVLMTLASIMLLYFIVKKNRRVGGRVAGNGAVRHSADGTALRHGDGRPGAGSAVLLPDIDSGVSAFPGQPDDRECAADAGGVPARRHDGRGRRGTWRVSCRYIFYNGEAQKLEDNPSARFGRVVLFCVHGLCVIRPDRRNRLRDTPTRVNLLFAGGSRRIEPGRNGRFYRERMVRPSNRRLVGQVLHAGDTGACGDLVDNQHSGRLPPTGRQQALDVPCAAGVRGAARGPLPSGRAGARILVILSDRLDGPGRGVQHDHRGAAAGPRECDPWSRSWRS